MAALFDDANTQFLEADSLPVASGIGGKVSMNLWFNDNDGTFDGMPMVLANSASETSYLALTNDASGANVARAQTRSGGSDIASSTTSYTIDVWNQMLAVFDDDADDRSVYLNGGSKGTNTDAQGFPTWDKFSVGANLRNTNFGHFSGLLAEAAVWNVALTDADAAILGAGYSPLFVKPGGLVFYAPLIRPDAADDWMDIISGIKLVGNGGTGVPVVAPHPRIIMPSEEEMHFVAGGAPPAVGNPWYQYAQQRAVV